MGMSARIPARGLLRPLGWGERSSAARAQAARPVHRRERTAAGRWCTRVLRAGERVGRSFPLCGRRVGLGLRVCRAARRCEGFTLLETMVALVIFAAAAMALYGLFNTNLIALARAHDVSRQAPAVRHAIEHLSSINPREEGAGRIAFDRVEVVWSSRLLEPLRQSQSRMGGRGYFEVGLYEVEFTVRDGEDSLGIWRMRVAGYEKVREPAQ